MRYQPISAQVYGRCEQRTNHAGPLDLLHVAVRGGDFPVAAVELTGGFRRRTARHLYSKSTHWLRHVGYAHRADRQADRQVPDAVGEEEVRRVDGRQLWQEGGRNRNSDVTGGCHATLIVHVPADAW